MKLTVQVPKREPVKKYLEAQGRFKHLKQEDIQAIQARADLLAAKYGLGPVREQV
jgi:pyruvate ferredoxin oxidoreductase beta subunit